SAAQLRETGWGRETGEIMKSAMRVRLGWSVPLSIAACLSLAPLAWADSTTSPGTNSVSCLRATSHFPAPIPLRPCSPGQSPKEREEGCRDRGDADRHLRWILGPARVGCQETSLLRKGLSAPKSLAVSGCARRWPLAR